MTNLDLTERRDRLLGAGAPLFYDEPVNIVRGEGVYLFDNDGRRYVDMYNNVPCVGHCHPHVVEAMQAQAATLNVHSRYLHEGILDYAERLTGHLDPSLSTVVFACTGTEANEVAMRMARVVTGGRGFICTNSAYHGNSAEVGKLTRVRETRDAVIRSIPFPETYRPMDESASGEALTDLYLKEVERAIDELAADDIPLAGMLVCPILANEGLPDIPEEFMPRAAAMIHEAGGLFISDEVQAGFCRTGNWWGYEASGVLPDIVTLGKPMGAGLPLSGVVAAKPVVDAFRAATRYFNTFASSPLQAAVGMAVLDVIEDEGLRNNVAEIGAYLKGELTRRHNDSQPIGDIRGQGLFIGLEWVSDRVAKTPDREGAIRAVNRLKQKGFLTSNAGAFGNVLKIRPPLVFGRAHADAFLTAFDETMAELYGD